MKRWSLLWIGTGLLLALSRLVAQDWDGLWFVLSQMLFALGLSIASFWLIKKVPQAWISGLLFTLLAIMVLSGFTQRWLGSNSWRSGQTRVTSDAVITQLTSEDTENGGLRIWRIDQLQDLELHFKARLTRGVPGWNWYGEGLSLETSNGKVYTRWDNPSGRNLRRQYRFAQRLPSPLLVLWLEYRGSSDTCGRIQLVSSTVRLAQQLCVSTQWQSSRFEWQLPDIEEGDVLRLVLDQFELQTLDVFSVLQTADGLLAVPAPTGVNVILNWPGRDIKAPEFRFMPSSEWQDYRFQTDTISKEATRLIVSLKLEPGLGIEIGNMSLNSLDPNVPDPLALPLQQRQTLFAPHANLAGHMLATLGLSIMALSSGAGFVSWVVALAGVWLTGSRAAFLALVLGLGLFLLMRKNRWWYSASFILGMVLLTSLDVGRLIILDDGVVSRPEIWRLALGSFKDHPWSGVSTDVFRQLALEQGLQNVHHAHNLWLYFASTYGVLGFVASFWLTLGIIYLSWHCDKWRTLTFLVPVLVMNIFDVSLFYIGVLFPLILVLNSQLSSGRHLKG